MKPIAQQAEDYESLVRIANYQAHLKMAAYLAPYLHSGMRALDVGCGTGLVGVILSTLGIGQQCIIMLWEEENGEKTIKNINRILNY